MADDPEPGRAKDLPAHKKPLENRWLEENRAAIASYNKRVTEHGLLSDEIGFGADHVAAWRDKNRPAIDSINNFIDQHGLLGTKLRYRPTD
jgi:post-segregation antitoxin (ccd killing protein)